ncbi:MAG: DUF3783 domain-containing protein [Candidatus Thermoplasmatota archaeon]|nr:DUF3783 domain-containing protein [Candidatus Thermoplasmatota archaeon]
MDPIGVMLYGFDEDSADKIVKFIGKTCSREVQLVCADRRENDKVGDILDDDAYRGFQANSDLKVVMFLGFEGPMIHASMDNFPSSEGEKRPIFCTPTEENIGWKLSELLDDLIQEREYFKMKGVKEDQ